MIIRQQLCGGNAGARIPHGFARQGNPCAAQNAQRLGAGQNAGLVFICIVAQCGTIANKNQRLFALFYKSFQRSDRFGGVRGQPGVGGKVKSGPVHLAAAGVLCANHSAFPAHAVSQGSHGGNPGAGGVGRKSQPLDGGKTDAQPGKAAGTVGHGVQIQLGGGQAAGFQRGIDHGQQCLTVGQTVVALGLVQQGIVPQHRHSRRFAGGVQSQ